MKRITDAELDSLVRHHYSRKEAESHPEAVHETAGELLGRYTRPERIAASNVKSIDTVLGNQGQSLLVDIARGNPDWSVDDNGGRPNKRATDLFLHHADGRQPSYAVYAQSSNNTKASDGDVRIKQAEEAGCQKIQAVLFPKRDIDNRSGTIWKLKGTPLFTFLSGGDTTLYQRLKAAMRRFGMEPQVNTVTTPPRTKSPRIYTRRSRPLGSSSYTIRRRTSDAKMRVVSGAYMLLAGSRVAEQVSVSCPAAVVTRRTVEGLIVGGMLTKDITFASSSAAAAFVLGTSASGPKEWLQS